MRVIPHPLNEDGGGSEYSRRIDDSFELGLVLKGCIAYTVPMPCCPIIVSSLGVYLRLSLRWGEISHPHILCSTYAHTKRDNLPSPY